MAATVLIETIKAQSIQEAIHTVNGLLEEPSDRLVMAEEDFVAKQDPNFVAGTLIAELSGVVAELKEEVAGLKAAQKSRAKK